MQEEYIKAMLGGPPQGGNQRASQQRPGQPDQEDPMMKMLNQLMTGMEGNADPNNPGGMPFNPEELSKATGLPSSLANMLLGSQKAPPTPAELQTIRLWKIIHVVFALIAGIYHLLAINWAEETFGAEPPAPATFQNPFLIFVLGEILLQSSRVLLDGSMGKRGPGLYYQMAKQFARDGGIVVFILGIAAWWKGSGS
jgi:GET complex subunit GET2